MQRSFITLQPSKIRISPPQCAVHITGGLWITVSRIPTGFGVAMLPMQSVENAMAEMKFARETLGMCGGFLPTLSRQEDAKRSDVCVVLGPGGGARFLDRLSRRLDQCHADRRRRPFRRRPGGPSYGIARDGDDAGSLSRNNCGPAPETADSVSGRVDIDRMDRHFDDKGFNEFAPSMRPSVEHSSRWKTASPRDYIGPHKIMWATDYPHQDGFFPDAPQMLRERLGPLSDQAAHQVIALGFYGMN